MASVGESWPFLRQFILDREHSSLQGELRTVLPGSLPAYKQNLDLTRRAAKSEQKRRVTVDSSVELRRESDPEVERRRSLQTGTGVG
jgi:hypothetical protein